MSQLTQTQIDAMKNKGLSAEKIQAIATQRGFEMPKQSFGASLIKSEKGFGQSIAGAIGGTVGLGGTKSAIDQSNQMNQQIKTNLMNAIKVKRDKGEDTSRLISALKTMDEEVNFYDILNTSTGGSLDKSARQVFGEAAGVATDILGAGALPGGVGGITKATTIGGGIIQGAKAGAIGGAVFGGAQGASRAAQENMTGGEIVGQGIKGGVIGGAAGGVIGGAIGGVSGTIGGRAERVAQKKSNNAFEAITPKTKDLTPTEYEDLLRRGKITPKTATSPATYILSDAEKATAQKYGHLFGKDPVKNSTNIMNEIAKKDTEVGTFLRGNNGIYNKGEAKNFLLKRLEDVTDVTIPESRINKLKTTIVDGFLKNLEKNDMESMWKSRKLFDRSIEKVFGGSPTLQNQVKREFRNAVQDFIAERTPEGVYKQSMKEMTNLYGLFDTVSTKATKERGSSAIQAWIRANPAKAKVIGWTGATGIVGSIGISAFR